MECETPTPEKCQLCQTKLEHEREVSMRRFWHEIISWFMLLITGAYALDALGQINQKFSYSMPGSLEHIMQLVITAALAACGTAAWFHWNKKKGDK